MTQNSKNPVGEAPTQSRIERPRNITAMIAGLGLVCLGLVLADLAYENPHPHFEIESSFGFHAWFGFLAFVVIVFAGRVLRVIVSRPEDYYERHQ